MSDPVKRIAATTASAVAVTSIAKLAIGGVGLAFQGTAIALSWPMVLGVGAGIGVVTGIASLVDQEKK